MYRITQLARRQSLSRSTLLPYDRIGRLRASDRAPAGYRCYAEKDRRHLAAICRYCPAGPALQEIRMALDSPDQPGSVIVKRRLETLGRQIRDLQNKQRVLAGMLKSAVTGYQLPGASEKMWGQMLPAAGQAARARAAWHPEFENRPPRAHHAFPGSLGLPEEAALKIRQTGAPKGPRLRAKRPLCPMDAFSLSA